MGRLKICLVKGQKSGEGEWRGINPLTYGQGHPPVFVYPLLKISLGNPYLIDHLKLFVADTPKKIKTENRP